MGRKISRKGLVKKADKAFSLYIRQRDSDTPKTGNCSTCGKRKRIKAMDCGHFRSRRHYATRWDEHNACLQCKDCNGFGAGEQYKMGLFLESKFGIGVVESMEAKSRQIVKLSDSDLNDIIEEFTKKLNEL